MLKIRKIFEDEMDLGLQVNPKGCLQMANTYIPQLPDGSGKQQKCHFHYANKG